MIFIIFVKKSGDFVISERTKIAKERLQSYYDAEKAILSGQEYKIGTRLLKRPDLQVIRDTIKQLEIQVAQYEAIDSGRGPRRAIRITPRDY